jgi:hypothetical protein
MAKRKSKFENSLLKTVMKKSKYITENFGEDEEAGITAEQKRSFTEAVGNYHQMGESIYRNSSLREITETLGEIVKVAESLTLQESEHWFDNVTTSRHMKQLKEAYKVFSKTANEVHTLQQRLESAYEDMGGVLNKYYKINEALKEEESKPDYLDMDKDGDTEEPMKTAIKQKDEGINIDAKTLKKISPNLLKKLSKKMDITIDELKEKLVFYKDKEDRLRRFDTDNSANKKYQ